MGAADRRRASNPAVNAESPLSGESRVVESQAGQYKPLRAHQDVQHFLVGIHKSAEKEAQAEVELLRQQEHSKMMSELFRRQPAQHLRLVSEFEENSSAYRPQEPVVSGLESHARIANSFSGLTPGQA